MGGATVAQAAAHFKVDRSTIRKWIAGGDCPVVRRGTRGPGRGAVLDLAAVAAWRGGPVAGPVGFSVDEVMEGVAAAVAFMVFGQIAWNFGRAYRTDEYPAAIRALLPLL
jgi:hypothetical protein